MAVADCACDANGRRDDKRRGNRNDRGDRTGTVSNVVERKVKGQ